MRIKVQRRDLLLAMQRVQGVVEKRSTMPILSHLLMEASDNKISVFATDMEMGIQGVYPAQVIEPGKLTLSAKKLYELVREFEDGMIDIQTQENNWVVIQFKKSHFRVAGLPPEEFPNPPSLEEGVKVMIDPAIFSTLIRKTLFASGENDARYVLNGILIQLQGGKRKTLKLVATNGHRLAMAEGEANFSGEREDQFIVPKKALIEIKKVLDEGDREGEKPELLLGKNQILFRSNALVITSRLMEGSYPNYKQVIPISNHIKLTTKKEALEGGLRRVSLLSREKTSAVRFTLEKSRLLLNSSNPELGEANEEIVTDFSGEVFSTGFNARYFIDILGVIEGEETVLEFKDASSPCLVRDEKNGFLAVVMPMRG